VNVLILPEIHVIVERNISADTYLLNIAFIPPVLHNSFKTSISCIQS